MFLRSGKKNMEFKLEGSETFLEELNQVCNYIENVLMSKEASTRLKKRIRHKLEALKYSPEIYQKIESTDRYGRHYRRIVINNYIILYIVLKEEKTVLISHIYYGRRNYIDGGYL